MPGQQDSSTPASTGSESLRANAAEFVPKLRATATAFVPSSSYVYATPRMQVGMPPIQRPSFYAPRHHRIDVPGLPPNPAMMNHHPMMSMGQHPYHFQQGYMGAPIHPQFHPGMVQGSVMMPHDPQSNRRRTMSPSKPMEEEVVKHHAVAVDATSQPENLIATDKLEADRKSAVEGRSAQDVSDSAIERPDGCELEHELQDSEEQPRVEASAVPPAEVSSSELPAEVSDSLSHPDVSVADTVETEVEAPGKTIPESSMSPNQPAVVSTEPDLATGDEASGCAAESDSENMETSENQVADNSEPESSEISALRYTVQQILEVRDRIQAEKDVNRPPAVVIDPVKYSVQEIMTFQNKFNDTPAFVNPSLDCIGSPLASRPQSSAGGARDRRSSVDRRGYHGSGQRERGARVYDKARSRDPSRSREISRANFGHLQGTVKPIDERDNRRRQDRERDRFDGPVRAVEPQIEPLAMSDNRYIVKKDVQGEELALRQVQSVLNKLTPEKFDRLVTQLIELIMSHLDHLEKIIGLVFDKAVNEFNFAHMYSDLCHCLHKRLAGHESEVGRFRVILLERCRLEFESRSQASESIGSISDEDERETAIFLSRRRSRGLLTFIGHLFNRQLLHFQVINRCLAQLTPHTSIQCGRNIEWDIEDTCTLWAVMGKKYASLRNEDVQKVVEVSFQIIENVIEAREVSSRMIFMLKDLVDLRNNRWEPRRELVVASTLAEVHKKAAQEALAKERAAQKADRAERRRRDDRDPRFESRRSTSVALGNTFGSGDGRSRLSTVDGWSHKVSKSKRGVNASDQPIRVSHSVKDLKSYQPAGRSAEVQESKPSVNAFSLLTHSDDEEETQTPVATSAEETEGEEVSYDTSASDQELSLPEVDENEVRNRVKRMVEEFVSIEDYNEVLLATSELPSPSLHHVVVSESLSFAAEGKPKARELIPKMILHLFQNGKLSGDQITAGLSEFLELLEDLEIDIPKIRCHTGEFIARFIEGQALPVSYLVTIANFKHVPLKTLQSMNAESLPDLIRGENLDLHAVLSASFPLKEGGDMSSFLLNNDLQSLIQCLR